MAWGDIERGLGDVAAIPGKILGSVARPIAGSLGGGQQGGGSGMRNLFAALPAAYAAGRGNYEGAAMMQAQQYQRQQQEDQQRRGMQMQKDFSNAFPNNGFDPMNRQHMAQLVTIAHRNYPGQGYAKAKELIGLYTQFQQQQSHPPVKALDAQGNPIYVSREDSFGMTPAPTSPGTSVNVSTGAGAYAKLGDEMAKAVLEGRADAVGAQTGLRGLLEARKIIDSGIVTGTGANFITDFGNLVVSRLGMEDKGNAVANTQAFAATMGIQVGQIIKQFGAGTGLSDADREYAEKIVGGNITVSEGAIRKLMEINERAFRNVISAHNKRAAQVAANQPEGQILLYDLAVEMPGAEPEIGSGQTSGPPADSGATPTGRVDSAGNDIYRMPDGREMIWGE
jgi:hypothetical protein